MHPRAPRILALLLTFVGLVLGGDALRCAIPLMCHAQSMTCAQLAAVEEPTGRYDLSECSLDATSPAYRQEGGRLHSAWVFLRPRGQSVDVPAHIVLSTAERSLLQKVTRATQADDGERYIQAHWGEFYYRVDAQYAQSECLFGLARRSQSRIDSALRGRLSAHWFVLQPVSAVWIDVLIQAFFALSAFSLLVLGVRRHRIWARQRAEFEAEQARIAREEEAARARAVEAARDRGL